MKCRMTKPAAKIQENMVLAREGEENRVSRDNAERKPVVAGTLADRPSEVKTRVQPKAGSPRMTACQLSQPAGA